MGDHLVTDLVITSLFMNARHNLFANTLILHTPGWVACNTSVTASFIALGIVNPMSSRMQPSFTLSCFKCAWICLLTALQLCLSPCVMQSLNLSTTESRLVMAAIIVALKTSLIALSNWRSVSGRSSLFVGLMYVEKKIGLFAGFCLMTLCSRHFDPGILLQLQR